MSCAAALFAEQLILPLPKLRNAPAIMAGSSSTPNSGSGSGSTNAASTTIASSSTDKIEPALTHLSELQSLEQLLYQEFYTSNQFLAILKRTWSYILGVSAFIELLSFVVPFFFLPPPTDEMDQVEYELRPRLLFFLPRRRLQQVEDAMEDESISAAEWLRDNCYHIGVVFNCLWTVHSFVVAGKMRRKALRRLEKKMLLKGTGGGGGGGSSNNSGDRNQDVTTTTATTNTTRDAAVLINDDDDKDDDGDVNSNEATTAKDTAAPIEDDDNKDDENDDSNSKKAKRRSRVKAFMEQVSIRVYSVGGSWGVYLFILLWMLLVLPVGFFIRISHELKTYAGMDLSGEVESALDEETMEALHVMTKKTKYCLPYAVLLRFYTIVAIAATVAIEDEKHVLKRRIIKFLGSFAIRHPITFRRRLRKTLTTVRWAKYLAPLIGTGNKLIGQLRTLRKRHTCRQAEEAETAKKVRRQAYKAMLNVRAKKREAAAAKIQSVLREKAARARVNVLRKKQELRSLQMQQYGASRIRRKVKKLDVDAKRRLYQLEAELASEVKDLKWRKMLLRPNTNFAVTWRVLFVVCVILEITHLALEPRVAQHRDEAGQRLTVGMVLEHYLVPDPVGEWPQCSGLEIDRHVREEHIISNRRKSRRKKNPKPKNDADDTSTSYPWYCHHPYSTAQEAFVYTLRYLIKDLLILISIICFMDVFVTFFTGEICSETGVLKPKPFTVRWLLPGLMLQMLVNPKMAEVSAAIKRLWRGIHYIGPARVWRWTVVLIEPVFFAFYGWYERNVWSRMVVVQNTKAKPVR